MNGNTQLPGGFILDSLPSPSPSTASTTNPAISTLPHPRTHPLRPGSGKEDITRRYIETRLLHISRRYTKKFQELEDDDEGTGGVSLKGYTSFSDVARELGEVVDVLWRSGTPNLQVPYLLQIALSTSSYLPSFPPSPNPTFALLQKLDHAFVSLITGKDKTTGETLPGFESADGGLSRTDMVRLRSLVLDTRVIVVSVMNGFIRDDETGGEETGAETETETETSVDRMSVDVHVEDDEDDETGMEVGKVYEATIEQLNLSLGDGFNPTG